jgi:hypothetical protein
MGGFIVKLLGLVDLTATAMLFTAAGPLFSVKWILIVAVILAVKGVVFVSDPVSKFDVILALYLAFTLVHNIGALSAIFGIYLGFKGLYSLF